MTTTADAQITARVRTAYARLARHELDWVGRTQLRALLRDIPRPDSMTHCGAWNTHPRHARQQPQPDRTGRAGHTRSGPN